MPESIRDGKGRGYLAEVTTENRMKTASVTRSKEHDANLVYGSCYNMLVDLTPTGAGDCFMYIKNTGTKNIVIEGFGIYAASAEKIKGMLNDSGTPVGGTDFVPVALNTASGKAAVGIFQTGVDITGLSGGTTFQTFRIPANGATNSVNFEADIVVAPGGTFTAYAVTGGVALEGHMVFWIDEEGA